MTSNPIVINGLLYLRTKDGRNFRLNAYDVNPLRLIWSHKIGQFCDQYTISGRVTILCPFDGHCYQLDARTGALVKPEWEIAASTAKILIGTLGKYSVMHTYGY
jgi:outer membrane protein assembly factor BamB